VRTTFAVPSDLLGEVDRVVEEGKTRNRNELVVQAFRRMIDQINREADDAAFALMATDSDYQRDTRIIAGEFERGLLSGVE